MKRVGIFGIGAIGSVLTKYLSRNTESELYFFNRTKHKSIKIIHNQEEDEIQLNLPNELNSELNWLLICLKEHQIKEAKNDIKGLIGEQTKLAIFQNGINISKPYEELSNKNQILETIIDCPTERISKRNFKQIKNPKIVLPKSKIANEFMNLFVNDEEVKFELTQDFNKSQWLKLIESSTIGSIQSITKKPCSIFQETKYLNDYKLMIKEGIKVAQSESIYLGSDMLNELLLNLENYPVSKGSSMLTDRMNGKTLELEAKIGAIVNTAKRNNINVPISDRYYKSLLDYNSETVSNK